jgi:hypothetical protein
MPPQAELIEGGDDPVMLGLGEGHRIDPAAVDNPLFEGCVFTAQPRVGAQGVSEAAHGGDLGAASWHHMHVDPVLGHSMPEGAPQHRPGSWKGGRELGLEAEPAQGLGDGRDVGPGADRRCLFHIAVQSSLLSRLYGLNRDLPALMADAVPDQAQQIAALAALTRPVDPVGVRAYLGLYSDGFLLRLDDTGPLHLDHDIRSMPVLAMPDRGYIVVDGPGVIAQKTVAFTDDAGYPKMAIEGFEPVRWLTAG